MANSASHFASPFHKSMSDRIGKRHQVDSREVPRASASKHDLVIAVFSCVVALPNG